MLTSKIVEFQDQKVADLRSVLLNRNFAIVDIQVLERLVEALGISDINAIKTRLIEKIEGTRNMDQLVDVLASEVSFRNTISGLQRVDLEDLSKPIEKKLNGQSTSVTT